MIFDVRWAVSTLSFQTFVWRDDLCVSPRIGSPPHHHPTLNPLQSAVVCPAQNEKRKEITLISSLP